MEQTTIQDHAEITVFHCPECNYDWEIYGTAFTKRGKPYRLFKGTACPCCRNDKLEVTGTEWIPCEWKDA